MILLIIRTQNNLQSYYRDVKDLFKYLCILVFSSFLKKNSELSNKLICTVNVCLIMTSKKRTNLFHDFPIRYAWIVESDSRSNALFFEAPSLLTHPSPTWFRVTKKGDIVGRIDSKILEIAEREKLILAPLISNYEANVGFSDTLFHEFITSRTAIKNFLAQLTRLLSEHYIKGINLDFENVSPRDEQHLIKLLKLIKQEFPDIVLSIDVPPLVDVEGTAWHYSFDYVTISQYVDHLIVMAYDYHWSKSKPGPITPLSWLDRIVNYTKSQVPLDKIVIGLPLYGYDWPKGLHGKGMSTMAAEQLANEKNVTTSIDKNSLEGFFEYYDENGTLHTVYYQTTEANKERLLKLKKNDIRGISYWYWGAASLQWFIA